MNSLSGGQKKLMLLYIALISKASVILADETFSELSVGENLNNALDAVVEFSKINNKIIILVGHGLLDIIPKNTIILTKEQLTKMD